MQSHSARKIDKNVISLNIFNNYGKQTKTFLVPLLSYGTIEIKKEIFGCKKGDKNVHEVGSMHTQRIFPPSKVVDFDFVKVVCDNSCNKRVRV